MSKEDPDDWHAQKVDREREDYFRSQIEAMERLKEQLKIAHEQLNFALRDGFYDAAQSYAEMCMYLCRRIVLIEQQVAAEKKGVIT